MLGFADNSCFLTLGVNEKLFRKKISMAFIGVENFHFHLIFLMTFFTNVEELVQSSLHVFQCYEFIFSSLSKLDYTEN